MNILFVNEYQVIENQGGVQRVTTILANFLSNHDFHIYFAFFKQYNKEKITAKNELFISNKNLLSRSNKILIRDYLVKNNIDIVINQMGFNHIITKLFFIINPHIPIISCLHSSPDFEIKDAELILNSKLSVNNSLKINLKITFKTLYLFFRQQKLSSKLNYIYDKSAYTVLLSENFKSIFLKISRIKDTSKLFYIENPLNPNLNTSSLGKSVKEKTVLYVGRLNKGKRVELLLRMWEKIQFSFPDWKFDIVGDGPDLEYLKSLAVSLKLKNTMFHGNSNAVGIYYDKSAIFVSASAFEGFPVVLTEASYYGAVPIVYNTYESVTDLIIDNYTGFIIKDLDQKSFMYYLTTLMQDEDLRNKLKENGFQHIKRFNIEQIGEKWFKLFKQLNI